MSKNTTLPTEWQRHAIEVARGIASIDRSKLPRLTPQFVEILAEAIVESMKMAADETRAELQTCAKSQTPAAPNVGDLDEVRGATAEFRKHKLDTYPHTAVELLLDSIDTLSNLVDAVLASKVAEVPA